MRPPQVVQQLRDEALVGRVEEAVRRVLASVDLAAAEAE